MAISRYNSTNVNINNVPYKHSVGCLVTNLEQSIELKELISNGFYILLKRQLQNEW